MKRYFILAVLFISTVFPAVSDAENVAVEKQLRERVPPPVEKEAGKKKLYFGAYEEYSWINQGSRKGKWKLSNANIAYAVNDIFLPYINVNAWDRLSNSDQTIDAGTYIRFKDNSYLRTEMGFGTKLHYLYRFQTTVEYERRLVKDYFGNVQFRFLDYPDNNVYIFSPGLRYYFGDHYISGFYNISSTNARGIAQWGTLKGNFTVNDRVNVYAGTAVGQRLYDIFLLDSSKQFGYIGFGGLDFRVYKDLKLRIGGSYSMEKPAFRKRSIDFGGSVKF